MPNSRFVLHAMALVLVLGAVHVSARGPAVDVSASDVGQDVASSRIERLEARLADHERRIAALERRLAEPAGRVREPRVAEGSDSKPIVVRLEDKKFLPIDIDAMRLQELVVFDIVYTSRLDQSVRSVKGRLQFRDLFGELKFQLRVTLDEPITAGETKVEEGTGFEYNQFKDDHRWVRTTAFSDMVVEFVPEAILLSDGTRIDY